MRRGRPDPPGADPPGEGKIFRLPLPGRYRRYKGKRCAGRTSRRSYARKKTRTRRGKQRAADVRAHQGNLSEVRPLRPARQRSGGPYGADTPQGSRTRQGSVVFEKLPDLVKRLAPLESEASPFSVPDRPPATL